MLLAEVARLSPPGRIGSTTGAVLAFGDAGALVLPLLFSAALSLTGGYAHGLPDRRGAGAGLRRVQPDAPALIGRAPLGRAPGRSIQCQKTATIGERPLSSFSPSVSFRLRLKVTM